MRAVAGLRETPKFTIIRLFGIVRPLLLQTGRELVAAGALARPEDVFFLHLDELHSLATPGDAVSSNEQDSALEGSPSFIQEVATRRQRYEQERLRRQIPLVLLSDGRAFYEGADPEDAESADALTGSGVSPGVVEGTVRVVLDPRGAQLAPGEILVCPGTDPAWTPLFLAAGGLVMEVGGLMTHGSVVAREYGIPAVVGVRDATTRLRTGQRIQVDGSAGKVIILPEEM